MLMSCRQYEEQRKEKMEILGKKILLGTGMKEIVVKMNKAD